MCQRFHPVHVGHALFSVLLFALFLLPHQPVANAGKRSPLSTLILLFLDQLLLAFRVEVVSQHARLTAHAVLTDQSQVGVNLILAVPGCKLRLDYDDVHLSDDLGRYHTIIGSHDQGSIGVLRSKGPRWEATVIDKALNTFVHEIEIGDVDGDGLNEIFATPSAPNRRDGTLQPGQVLMFRYDGREFSRHVIEAFEDRHAKELLLARVKGAGPLELYAVIEPRYERGAAPGGDGGNVEIKAYRFTGPNPVGTVIATLPDKKCRFLHAGDVDHDGQVELVASAFKSGIWMIEPEGDRWVTRLIDADSSGYEHASALADLDGDGKLEIYVGDDDGQMLRRYLWNGQEFERRDLLRLTRGDITFGLMPCVEPRCLRE